MTLRFLLRVSTDSDALSLKSIGLNEFPTSGLNWYLHFKEGINPLDVSKFKDGVTYKNEANKDSKKTAVKSGTTHI